MTYKPHDDRRRFLKEQGFEVRILIVNREKGGVSIVKYEYVGVGRENDTTPKPPEKNASNETVTDPR